MTVNALINKTLLRHFTKTHCFNFSALQTENLIALKYRACHILCVQGPSFTRSINTVINWDL